MSKPPLRILVLTGDGRRARLIRRSLERGADGPLDLDEVSTLPDALARLDDGVVFGCLLVDLALPPYTHFDVMFKIRAHAPSTPIVAIAPGNDPGVAVHAVQQQIDGYLVHAEIDAPALYHHVVAAIERHRVRRDLEDSVDELRSSEACLRHIIERNTDAMLVTDRAGKVLFANPAVESVFDCPARELRGTMLGFPLGATGAIEVDVLRNDGEILVAEIHLAETVWRGHRAMVVSLRDITNRLRAIEAKRESEALTHTLLDSAADGICGVDIDGNTTFVNVAAARFLGVRPRDLILEPFHERVHHTRMDGSTIPRAESPIHTSLRDGKVRRINQELFWRRDGTNFPVEFTVAPVRDDGAIVGAVITFTDVTEKHQFEAQLLQAKKFEGIGHLAAGIAHEINSPTQYVTDNVYFLNDSFERLAKLLTGVERLIETVRTGGDLTPVISNIESESNEAELEYLIEEVPRATKQTLEGLDRISGIVRAMKEFSHPGMEQKEPIDLNHAIETTTTVCRNEWRYVADLNLELDRSLPLVQCVGREINQVVLNIVVNAAQAIAGAKDPNTMDKGTITVSTTRDSQWVELRITDSGPGIPEEIREKIFDPFFTTKEVGRGTGQGLAIAHAVVVDHHQGNLDIETAPGEGTTFIIRLPLDDDTARKTAAFKAIDERPAPNADTPTGPYFPRSPTPAPGRSVPAGAPSSAGGA